MPSFTIAVRSRTSGRAPCWSRYSESASSVGLPQVGSESTDQVRGIVPVPPMEMKRNGTVLEHPTTPSASVVGKLSARRPPSDHRRSFSVNVALRYYYCHGCRSHGNQLELWAAATKLPLHQAAIDRSARSSCRRTTGDVVPERNGAEERPPVLKARASHRLSRSTVSQLP